MKNTPLSLDQLLTDYRLKVNFLEGHFSRLLSRFNYFLSIELAIFGLFGYLWFNKEITDALIFPILLGLPVSIIWLFFARQDRALVRIYQKNKDHTAKIIGERVGETYTYENDKSRYTNFADFAVGSKKPFLSTDNKFMDQPKTKRLERWIEPKGYSEKLSITKLPIFLSGILVLWWLLALLIYMLRALIPIFEIGKSTL